MPWRRLDSFCLSLRTTTTFPTLWKSQVRPHKHPQTNRYLKWPYIIQKSPLWSLSDQIALPDFSAGAMENWGLITYRETALLYDPAVSSNGDKEWVASVIAHELAHMVSSTNVHCNYVQTDVFTNPPVTWRSVPSVVWEPGDDEVVEWPVAQRGVCLLRLLPGSRPRRADLEHGEFDWCGNQFHI